MKKRIVALMLASIAAGAAQAQNTDSSRDDRARQNREAVRKMFPVVGIFDKEPVTGASSSTTSANAAAITPAQSTVIDRLIASSMQTAVVAADVREAAPLIHAILATGACAKNNAAWNMLSRQMVQPKSYPDYSKGFLTPRASFKYHEDASCLDVLRLTEWAKPANNALSFKAYFVSPQSGEAVRQSYVLQKGSIDGWMIKELGSSVS